MRITAYAWLSTLRMKHMCQLMEAVSTWNAPRRRQKVPSLSDKLRRPSFASRVRMNIVRKQCKNAIHMLCHNSVTMDLAYALIHTLAATARLAKRDSNQQMRLRMETLNVYLMRNIWAKQFVTHMDNPSPVDNTITSTKLNVNVISITVDSTVIFVKMLRMRSPTAHQIRALSFTTLICNMLSSLGSVTTSTATQLWLSITSQMTL